MLNCSYFLSQFISPDEFIFGSFIVLAMVWWFLFKTVRDRAEQILVGIVIGGAILNLLERAVFGCVRDYFNFFGLFRYNVWDIIITVGVLTILLRTAIKKSNAQ